MPPLCHIIIVKVISELIFIILGEWETESLPLWFLPLQYIFLKRRHLVLGAAQEGLAEMISRIVVCFVPFWKAFSCSLSCRLCVSCCRPEIYMTNVRMFWGHKNALAVLVLPTCTVVAAVTSSSHLPAFRPIEILSLLPDSFHILAKIGGRGRVQFVIRSKAFTFKIMPQSIFSGLVVLLFLYKIIHYNHVDLSGNQWKVVKKKIKLIWIRRVTWKHNRFHQFESNFLSEYLAGIFPLIQ